MRFVSRFLGTAILAAFVGQVSIAAQAAPQSLGSVTINKSVVAAGPKLDAGTYTWRLAPEDLSKVVGQTPSESRWVEFVRGGKVVGKEVATILSGPEAKAVIKGGAAAPGTAKVQMLKGNDYMRIWITRGGTTYLIHLPVK